MSGFRTNKVSACVCCHRSWDDDQVKYRARGLCIDCYIVEGRYLRQWAQLWLYIKLGRAAPWIDIVQRVLRDLPGSTIEHELNLEPRTVARWFASRDVPREHQRPLIALASKSGMWRWADEVPE